MYPRLIHIYGPLWIQSYGTMIALGVIVFLYLSYNHPWRRQYISGEHYINLLSISLVSGVVGARLLFAITNWQEFSGNWIEVFYPWVGGLTVLGSILGILVTVPFYFRWYHLQPLPILDLGALHAPLISAIARFGCLLAGCCYGAPCSLPWAITFTNPHTPAPVNIPLHPTQIYTSIASLMIFLVLYWLSKQSFFKHGQVLFLYLTLENISRFTIDFWRGDREELTRIALGHMSFYFSTVQLLSLTCLVGSVIGFIYVSVRAHPSRRKAPQGERQ